MKRKKNIVFGIILIFLILFVVECTLRIVSFTRTKIKEINTEKKYSDCEKRLLELLKQSRKKELLRYNHPVEGPIGLARDLYIVEKDRYYKAKPNRSVVLVANKGIGQISLPLDSTIVEVLEDFDGEVVYKNYDNLGLRKTGRKKSLDDRDVDISIAMLGDSFTEGRYVSDEDTFSAYVEKYGEKEGLNLDVSNMGVASHSSKEAYFSLVDFLSHKKVGIVILNFFPNDVYVDEHKVVGYWKPKEPQNKFGKWVFDNVFIARIVMEGWFSLFSKPLNPTKDKEVEEGWKATFYYLSRTKEVCNKDKILFFLVAIPPKQQFEFDLKEFYQHKLKKFCNEKGIIFLDPYDYLKQRNVNELYLDWDPHFTKKGQRIYGYFIYQQIKPYFKNQL